jgi:hypothetical protein
VKQFCSHALSQIFWSGPAECHTFAQKKKIGFTPNQRKTPSPSGLGFFVLNAFKRFEGLLAVQASVQGLAGGGTKGSNALRLGTFASGAVQGSADAQKGSLVAASFGRRGYAVGLEFAKALFADPVGGPWRVKYGFDAHISLTNKFFEGLAHVALDDFGGGAARVGGAQVDFAAIRHYAQSADYAQIENRQGWNFRVGYEV